MQVGPLTFAVSILDAAASTGKTPSPVGARPPSRSPDDVSTDDIDSWLVGPNSPSTRRSADRRLRRRHDHDQRLQRRRRCSPSRRRRPRPATTNTSGSPTTNSRKSDEPFDDGRRRRRDHRRRRGETVDEVPEEFLDESNPFYAAKKAQKLQAKQGPAGPAKARSRTPATRPATSFAG